MAEYHLEFLRRKHFLYAKIAIKVKVSTLHALYIEVEN